VRGTLTYKLGKARRHALIGVETWWPDFGNHAPTVGDQDVIPAPHNAEVLAQPILELPNTNRPHNSM
jgi:hypothetical protein